MKLGILCQSCGLEAPSRHVEFHQNIGVLIMRFHTKFTGELCKRCIHHKFWSMTGITLAIGWLGLISIILAPFFVLSNVVHYLRAVSMPAVPPGARVPHMDEEIFSRFLHRADEVFQRIQQGENASDVAKAIAPQIGITPGQVLKSMVMLVQHRQVQTHLQEQNRAAGMHTPRFTAPDLAEHT